MCSVGGLLIFGKSVENVMSQNGISFAHFHGDEITDELIDKKIICGRLQDIAEQMMVILKNNMKNPSTINKLKREEREEREEYPMLVLREAIINALVHINYSILGSKMRIFMFDNRIEFHSPGKSPNTVTIEKMKIGVSYARNPFLVKYEIYRSIGKRYSHDTENNERFRGKGTPFTGIRRRICSYCI